MVAVNTLNGLTQGVAVQSASSLEVPLAVDEDDIALAGSVDVLVSAHLMVVGRLSPASLGGGVAVPVGVGLGGGIISDSEQLVVGVVGIVDAAVVGHLGNVSDVGAAVLVDGGVVAQLVSVLGRGDNIAGAAETVHADIQRNGSLDIDMVDSSDGDVVLNAAVIGSDARVLFLRRRSLFRNLGIVVQVDVELGAHGGVFVAGSVNTVCFGVVADLGLISSTVVPVHLAVCFLAVGNLDEVLQLAAVALGGGVDAVLANGVVGTAHDVGGRDGLEASSVLVGVGDGTVIVHLVEGLRADAVDGGGVQHCLIVGMIGNHSVVSGLLKILCSECSDRRHAAGGHCHAQNGRGNALITFHWKSSFQKMCLCYSIHPIRRLFLHTAAVKEVWSKSVRPKLYFVQPWSCP